MQSMTTVPLTADIRQLQWPYGAAPVRGRPAETSSIGRQLGQARSHMACKPRVRLASAIRRRRSRAALNGSSAHDGMWIRRRQIALTEVQLAKGWPRSNSADLQVRDFG